MIQFDVNQTESAWYFLICLKATPFLSLFDLDQMTPALPL
jgi:hypothetical protein